MEGLKVAILTAMEAPLRADFCHPQVLSKVLSNANNNRNTLEVRGLQANPAFKTETWGDSRITSQLPLSLKQVCSDIFKYAF